MALVLLPCDLPSWPTLQRALNGLKAAKTTVQLKRSLLAIYNLCNTSLEPEEEPLADQTVFDVLCDVMETQLSDQERRDFFDTQLPTIVDYALQLKSLKPTTGLHYSLQQQSDRVEIDRSLAASLIAHAFLSTFPRRTAKTHPTLQDFNFAGHFFHHLHRRSQRSKLRSILHYFQRLSQQPPEGRLTFTRQVMSGREWCTLEEWLQCRRPLCPMLVRHEGRIEATAAATAHHATENGLRVCFANRRIGGSFLDDGTSQECAAFSSHPELLSLLPYVESLEDNEALTASGLCTYSIIHDLKNKAADDNNDDDPPKTNNNNNNNNSSSSSSPTLQETSMCLLDAEDYSDLPVRQYEEDNVLRELNKAYLGFRHPLATTTARKATSGGMEERLPPVGASRDSSPSRSNRLPAVVENQGSSSSVREETDPAMVDLSRSATLVGSCDPSRRQSEASTISTTATDHDTDNRRSSNPTLLYGGGRNAPLTLTNATIVKQAVLPDSSDVLRPPPMLAGKKSTEGSIYASCDSQHGNSSVEEFRSANTSLEEDDRPESDVPPSSEEPKQGVREPVRQESQSLESDCSSELRPGSRGFALDGQGLFEDDSFSGDGLERERKWVEQFRERRAGSRTNRSGGLNKDSSSSSKDSSRYSFSTEFSSELDELYDQFSHWLEDPNNDKAGKNGRNAAVFRFAHGLLKRTLSDSFASVAMNIEQLSTNAHAKDIKLSSSSKSAGSSGPKQRSWSLADHVCDERLALQLAKEMVDQGVLEEEALPMPDLVPVEEVIVQQPAKNNKKVASSENSPVVKAPPERVLVRLLDRSVSPVNDMTTSIKSQSEADSDTQVTTPAATPMNPTPPRTRRGSWIFKKSREQRHHNHPQRARSNSVPAVMDVAQLTLWQQHLAERGMAGSLIPDIIVSGENTEDECFQPAAQPSPRPHHHRSYEDRLGHSSRESLISDDVVEGFSWTMAEMIIEDILKEISTSQRLAVRTNKKAPGKRKGILKLSSNDSLNRSHSGSLDRHDSSSQPPTSPVVRLNEPDIGANHESSRHMSHQSSSSMSWSQRSTSMPSLRAIDELETIGGCGNNLPSYDDEGDIAGHTSQDGETRKASNGSNATGLLPIITGNWGCGSNGGGDAQLKSMLQWMAASRAGAPSIIYYTAGASSVVKLDIVCRVIADRQWTVGDLAGAVLRYCRCRIDPRRLDLIASSSNNAESIALPALSSDRLLFDELLGPLKQTEL